MKKLDWILIGALLAIGLIIVATQHINTNKQDEKQVEITVDGKAYKTLDLSEDQVLKILGKDEHYNVIQIKDGIVDMIEADCKNQVCVESATIDEVGETIVCLPHKVIVKVTAKRG